MRVNCPLIRRLGEKHAYVRNNWLLLSATDTDLLNGALLSACRHISIFSTPEQAAEFTQFANQYKLKFVRQLQESIASGHQASRVRAVTRALVLAFDDVRRPPFFFTHIGPFFICSAILLTMFLDRF